MASVYTHTASFLNIEAFTHNKLLHREAFTHSKLSRTASVYTQNTHAQCFYTWLAFTHRNFYTETLLHTEKLLHTTSFYTEKLSHTANHSKLSHTASVYTQNTCTQLFYTWQAFTHRNFYTETLLHTEKLLHTASFYTANLLHTASFYRKKFLQREAFLYIITTGIAAPKPDGSRRQSEKNTILQHFLKELSKGKL